jgi:hypothetical protein
MALETNALNLMLDELGTNITYVALHSGPGSADELSGGSPAYARKAISWNTAASGNLDSAVQPQFDVPGGSTVSHVGYWSAATGGTFYGTAPVTNESYTDQGLYTLTDADIDLSNV